MFLEEWWKVFDVNNFLMLRTEDYSKNIKNTLRTVFAFLEVGKIIGAKIFFLHFPLFFLELNNDFSLLQMTFQRQCWKQSQRKKGFTRLKEKKELVGCFRKQNDCWMIFMLHTYAGSMS